jgi:hypothetical protein
MSSNKPSTSAKILYRPVGLINSIIGGLLAGIIFKQVWKRAAPEEPLLDVVACSWRREGGPSDLARPRRYGSTTKYSRTPRFCVLRRWSPSSETETTTKMADVGSRRTSRDRASGGAPARTDQIMHSEMRRKVNDMLAAGLSYAMIVRALEDDNAGLDKRDRVTIDSIRNHTVRHFPIQNVVRATYREMLERRARENQIDFVKGVATAITPMAFLETVMVRGYQTLVDERTTVSYRDGMEAALKLHEALRKEEGEYDKAHMLAEMGRIIDAVQEFIPREKWPELQAKLRGEPPPPSQITGARVPQAPPIRVIPISDRDEEE